MIVDYLHCRTDIHIITANTMPENTAASKVLRKNKFMLVASGANEDWGYDELKKTDKWIG